MNARIERLMRTGVMAGFVLMLGACAGLDRPAQPASERPVAERPRTAPAQVDAELAPAAAHPMTELLAARRRGDYPEIEANATGFTITEQVRIGGDVRADYERALGLLRQDRYAEGIALLEAVTEAAPDVTAPYIDLGIAYGRAGDLERAEAALETAALLSPDHPIVHNELGILYRRTGRFDEARESYEKALDVFADFHFARRNLGVLCDLYLADPGCALTHYSAYLASAPDDAEVAIWVADLRNRLGQ